MASVEMLDLLPALLFLKLRKVILARFSPFEIISTDESYKQKAIARILAEASDD